MQWLTKRDQLVTNAGGDIVGTVFGGFGALASTLNDNDNLGTLVSSVPPRIYTTTGNPPTGTASSNPDVKTKTVGGGPVTVSSSPLQSLSFIQHISPKLRLT